MSTNSTREGVALPFALCAGGGDEERGSHGFLEETALVPATMLAEVPAVIAPEDDDGAAGLAGFFQCVEHSAYLPIHIGNGSVVGADGLLLFVVGHAAHVFGRGC
jgi:hypothetical protein